MKKGLLTGFVIGGLVFGTVGVFAGQYIATENPFPILLNGNDVQLEGYNIEGSTYFKLRDIGEVIGFDVDFQNDTIMLSNNGYVYDENLAVDSSDNSSNIAYYADYPWCPDFGSYLNIPLERTIDINSGTVYVYDVLKIDDHTGYFDLLLNTTDLILNPASTADYVLFENLDSGHKVSLMLDKANYTINIIVGNNSIANSTDSISHETYKSISTIAKGRITVYQNTAGAQYVSMEDVDNVCSRTGLFYSMHYKQNDIAWEFWEYNNDTKHFDTIATGSLVFDRSNKKFYISLEDYNSKIAPHLDPLIEKYL